MRLNRIVWEPDWSGRSLVPVLDSTHKLLVAKGQRSLLSVRPVAMFSSKEYLAKKTGPWGVGRFRYLQALVTEFQDTNKQEHKLQVLANLANFAYDPINYEHFRRLNILDLFLDVLAEEAEEEMVEFAMGGVCNCCLDEQNKAYFIENDGVEFTIKCLSSPNVETVLSATTTLIYLTTPESKKAITAPHVVDLMRQFTESSNKRLSNLATVFLEDVCELPAVDSGFAGAPPKRPKLATSGSKGKEAAGAVPLGYEGLRQVEER